MNVIRPGGVGSDRILGQAEHSMEVILETLSREASERSHYRLGILGGVKEKGERATDRLGP